MTLIVRGIETELFERLRHGGADANGQAPLRRVAEGVANPCRHCLELIAEGDEKLVLGYRPFDVAQPYAETGPIFLHARSCRRYESDRVPGWFAFLEPAVVRGYDRDDWILYPTGDVVPGGSIEATCERILARADVAYVHVRSKFNCFQCRIDRA
jgi:hypothetical protein